MNDQTDAQSGLSSFDEEDPHNQVDAILPDDVIALFKLVDQQQRIEAASEMGEKIANNQAMFHPDLATTTFLVAHTDPEIAYYLFGQSKTFDQQQLQQTFQYFAEQFFQEAKQAHDYQQQGNQLDPLHQQMLVAEPYVRQLFS